MCTVCGCGQPAVQATAARSVPGAEHRHDHSHPDHDHDHAHAHGHDVGPEHAHPGHVHPHHHHGPDAGGSADPQLLDYAEAPAVLPDADGGATRILELGRDILAENNRLAAFTRNHLLRRGSLAVNLISGPGAGKTSLLVRTLQMLKGTKPLLVIEGDQQTSFDAERIRVTGVTAVQINTGQGCHLDARMVGDAVAQQVPPAGTLIFIENVGNLVCPAGFDLGEAHKVVLLSVTEGEDKPLKYADAFRAADLMLLTKVDLLPHVAFDRDACLGYARRVNPWIEVIEVSATRGDGLDAWCAWLDRRHRSLAAATDTGGGSP